MNTTGVRTLLKLRIPSKALKDEYANRFLNGLVERVKNGVIEKKKDGSVKKQYSLSDKAKEILLPGWNTSDPDDSILKNLLIYEPEPLKSLNDLLQAKLDGLFFGKPSRSDLLKIFGYEKMFNSSKSNAYWLSKKIDSNTCVYCNRLYAFTIEKGNGKNDAERIARPAFDHWFDKSDYPLMSLSLCNLIPSCTICNSSVKGKTKFDLATHTHPYVHETGHPDITFKVSLSTNVPPLYTITIATPSGSKEERTVKDMMLQEVYAMHGELEVRDIMEFDKAYPAGYLKQLFADVLKASSHKLTRSEVYRMLFGTEMDSSKFLDRPLSKMKYDILKYLGVI